MSQVHSPIAIRTSVYVAYAAEGHEKRGRAPSPSGLLHTLSDGFSEHHGSSELMGRRRFARKGRLQKFRVFLKKLGAHFLRLPGSRFFS